MVPGTRIPEWFDHITRGEYMTFWIRQKFPAIILCFALAIESEMKKILNCEIRFYINGDEVYDLEIPRSFPEMMTDHLWLYDLRTHPSTQWHNLDSYLMDDWNQIEISCEKIRGPPNVTVSCCGVHVCRQEANMKHILFKDPDIDSSRESKTVDTDLDANSDESIMPIEEFQNCKKVDDNNSYNFMNLEDSETLEKIIKQEENNISAWHIDMNQNQDKILLHPKTLDSVTKDSVISVCLGGNRTIQGKFEFYMDMHFFLVFNIYDESFPFCILSILSKWLEISHNKK